MLFVYDMASGQMVECTNGNESSKADLPIAPEPMPGLQLQEYTWSDHKQETPAVVKAHALPDDC